MNSRKNFLGVVHLVTERYQNLYIHWNSINEKEDGQTKRSYIYTILRHFKHIIRLNLKRKKDVSILYFICRLKGNGFFSLKKSKLIEKVSFDLLKIKFACTQSEFWV